jgi:tetratricopeptide (TPR) repeat protein
MVDSWIATMNMERSKTRGYRRWVVFLALLIILSPVPQAHPQGTAQVSELLPPPRPNLVAVHWPDLTQLEPEVREQLESHRAALATMAKTPGVKEPALGEAYGVAGEHFQAYSLNSAARECYFNAGILLPLDFRWVYLLARIDQQEDRTDDAIRRYRAARTLQPDYLAVPVNLGNIYLQLNRTEEAKESFTAALVINQNCAAALYGLGQVALSQKNYAGAIDKFEAALARAPGANRIHYSLGMAYRSLGEAEKTRAHLAQQGTVGVQVSDPLLDSLEKLIKGERIHLIRGKAALEARRYSEAIDEFRLAITANRRSLPAHINLGAALVQTGDPRGATASFEEALRIDPANSNAHYNLAVLLANDNKHEAAISHFREVLSLDPKDAGARFYLARELLRAGQLDEALAEFSQVAEADSNNEEALLNQVKLLQEKRDYKQALDRLKKAHEQYPQKGQTAVMLAYLLATSPQYDLRDGVMALQLAQMVYQASASPEHGAVVAMAMAELGRCAEATEWQRRMIAMAGEAHRTDLVGRLNIDLKRYEQGPPCRPVAEK